jgi:hypothetical protein
MRLRKPSPAAINAIAALVLALGAVTASAASATSLELDEGGVRVPRGANVEVELEFSRCWEYPFYEGDFHKRKTISRVSGHLSVNGAKTDKMTSEPEGIGCRENPESWASTISGSVKEVRMNSAGRATLYSSLRFTTHDVKPPPKGSGTCVFDFPKKVPASFPIPGQARIQGSATVTSDPSNEPNSYCGTGEPIVIGFSLRLNGPHKKLLETRPIG